MKFVEEWKKEELERSLEYYKNLMVKYNEVLEETKMECAYWNDRHYFETYKGMTQEECINEHNRLRKIVKDFESDFKSALATMFKFVERDKENTGYETYAVVKDAQYSFDIEYKCYKVQFKFNEEKAIEELTKLINKHFETLQAKVEKKIGKIVKIESLGGYDYEFIGEDGTCKVEVILAGGYNVQKLHTRWLIKK